MSDELRPDTGSEVPEGGSGHGRLFWAAFLAGWAVILFGLKSLLDNSGATKPLAFGIWIVGLALVHDLLLAPFSSAVGSGVRRVIRDPYWRIIRGGLMTTGVLVLLSIPMMAGFGLLADNPSLLPRDYTVGLALAVAVVWAVVALLIARIVVRGRRRTGPRG